MARRPYVMGVLAGLALAGLIPAAASAKVTTITWSTFLSGTSLQEMKDSIKVFERQNPDIKVKIITGGNLDQLLAMYAAGMQADVLHTVVGWAFDLIEKGMVLDVTNYFKASKFDYSKYVKFSPIYIREGRIMGGLETHTQVYPLFWNVTAFKQAGLVSPGTLWDRNQWNWDTFIDTAKRLTVDANGDGKPERYGTIALNWWEAGWYPWFATNGVDFYDAKAKKVRFDDPNGVKALEFMSDMISKYKVSPRLGTMDWNADYMKGKIAMTINGTWTMSALKNTKLNFDWDIAHPPKGLTAGTGIAPGAVGIVARGTKHPKEAFRFMSFFLGDTYQAELAKNKLCIPMQRKALESDAYLNTAPPSMKIIPEMIDYATPHPVFRGWPDVEVLMDAEVVKVLQGKKSAIDAMKFATTEGNKIIARYNRKK